MDKGLPPAGSDGPPIDRSRPPLAETGVDESALQLLVAAAALSMLGGTVLFVRASRRQAGRPRR